MANRLLPRVWSERELRFLPGDPGLCQQCWIVENKVEGEEEEEKRDHV